MQQVSDRSFDTSTGRWTARIKNGETVYQHTELEVTTTNTEFVAEQTRAGGEN